ncbi:hypothetical protein Tco_1546636 [Tanacetum coccineum]
MSPGKTSSPVLLFLIVMAMQLGLQVRLSQWDWVLTDLRKRGSDPGIYARLGELMSRINPDKWYRRNVSVWVKFHSIPMTAFSEDGLSVIATKLDIIMVAMPKLVGKGFICALYVLSMSENLPDVQVARQATRGVQVGPNVGFKPTKQVYRPVSNKNCANTSGKKSKLKCLDKSEVEEVFDEHVVFMASSSLKNGGDSRYGSKSLLEQWRETKRDDDYDPYDDDLYNSYNSYDMSDNLQAICDDLDIKVRDRKKK